MMGNLESARIAPQKQVGQREAKITAKIVMDALDVYEREIQQAAEPYSAMFCAIEYYEAQHPASFTLEQVREEVSKVLLSGHIYNNVYAVNCILALLAPKLKTPEDTNLAHKTIYFTGFAYDPRNQEESWPVTAAIDIKELISALKEAARGE
jgi:hypothetical protein